MMTIKPRRSVLYLPASNARAIEKVKSLPVDSVVLDLEDAVAPDAKTWAREALLTALASNDFGRRERVVRINTLETPWGIDDAIAMAASEADAICLPKVEHPGQVHRLIELLDQHGGGNKRLWVMAETPLGLQQVDAIATCSDRIDVLLMGTSDLCKELRIPFSVQREGLQYALQRCVIAARAANIDIIDGVFIDLSDEAGFEQSCQQGRLLGFDGKSVIHPKQLAKANAVFAPAATDVEAARKIVAAWEQRGDAGILVVDGKLVEELHVVQAQRNLALHTAINED